MFKQSFKLARAIAARIGLAPGNADMIATDATEDAWAMTVRDSLPITEMPKIVGGLAYTYARRERRGYAEMRELAIERGDEFRGAVLIAQEATQEDEHQVAVRLGSVRSAMERFEEPALDSDAHASRARFARNR